MISRQNILRLHARHNIYQFVKENPGLYVREISKKMKIPKSTLEYHLRFLEREKLINSDFQGRFKRFFVSDNMGTNEKKLLNIIRSETPKQILFVILYELICSQTYISKQLEKDPSTVSFHLKRLLKNEIIEVAPHTNKVILRKTKNYVMLSSNSIKHETFYRLKDPTFVEKVFIVYKNSLFPDNTIQSYIDTIYKNTINNHYKLPKIMKKSEDALDELIDSIFEIFPHPYYA